MRQILYIYIILNLLSCNSKINEEFKITSDESISSATQNEFTNHIISFLQEDTANSKNISFESGELNKVDSAYELDLMVDDTQYFDEKVKYYKLLSAYLSKAENYPVNINLQIPNSKELKILSSDSLYLENTLLFQDEKFDITAVHPLTKAHCDAVADKLTYLWKYIGNRPDSAHIKISKNEGIYYLDIPYNESFPHDENGLKYFQLTTNMVSKDVFGSQKTRIRLMRKNGGVEYVFENNESNYTIE